MAATIQTIEKPKRARALDTSTSEQESYEVVKDGGFSEDVSELGTGTNFGWNCGDDWVISSGSATCTNDSGNNNGNLLQNIDAGLLKGGETYRVTYTLSGINLHSGSGKFRIILYSEDEDGVTAGKYFHATGTQRNSNGTYTEDLTLNLANGYTSNQILFQTYVDPMTVTVDNVSVRKLESFGNNNHGQIYSGRALEFDGVSDYLSTGLGTAIDFSAETETANKAWTIACWVNRDSDISTVPNHITGGANSSSVYCAVKQTTHELTIWDFGASAWREGKTALEKDTWYRAVWVFDGIGNIKFYLNGVDDTDTSDDDIGVSSTYGDLRIDYIGAVNTSSRFWSGKLSDFQAWQGAWTAEDALYDYNNPEQLALNRGGTSLTNSNLKAWYPMNDGHRGQQSYILDASNTGLGDEKWDSDKQSGNLSGWVAYGSNEMVLDGDAIKVTYVNNTGGAYLYLRDALTLDSDLTVGQTYKMTVDAKMDGTAAQITYDRTGSGDLVNFGNLTTEWDTYELYFTAKHATNSDLRFNNLNVGEIGYVKNFSLKAINDKNHAKTVFYGDEKVANGDMNVTDPATVTIGGVAAAVGDATFDDSTSITDHTDTDTNNKTIKVTGDSSSQYPKITWADGSNMGLVAGRTYYVEVWVYLPSSNSLVDRVQLKVLDNAGSTELLSSATTATDAWTKLSGTFVDDDIASIQVIGIDDSGSPGGAQDFSSEVYYIDDLTVKEVGIATGWTDADQQLDIPQTALQSYNQLAWFDGVADCMTISDHGDFTFGTGSDDTPFSVSAWVFIGEASATGTGGGIVAKYSSGQAEWSLSLLDGYIRFYTYDQSETAHIGTKTDNRAEVGKWLHVVGTYSGNENSNGFKIYINGEEITSSDYIGGSGYAAMDNQSSDVKIGEHSTDFLLGSVTEVSIWSTELNQTQINKLYNDGEAFDATDTFFNQTNLKGYWRNNGITKWVNLKNPGTHDASITSLIESILITPGVNGSRDSQGFIMNRQRTTNSLNFYNPLHLETTAASLKEAPYVFLPKAPLMTDSTAVTNFSICAWIKWNRTPNQANAQSIIYDDVQETNGASYPKGLKLFIGNDNVLKCHVWHGYDNSTTKDFIYSQYDLDNIDQATITNPHSFGADGMWNGTQTSMAESKGIAYPADDMLSGNLPPDKWFHIAVTFDHDNNEGATNETANPSSNITVCAPFYTYVNGILVAKNGIDGNDDEAVVDGDDKTMQGIADHAAIIGSDMMGTLPKPGNNVNDTHGEIDELLMYSDTLTSKEVLRIYNAGKRSHK